jgi:hypothetical protein
MAMIEPCFGIGSNNSWRQRETEQGKAGLLTLPPME